MVDLDHRIVHSKRPRSQEESGSTAHDLIDSLRHRLHEAVLPNGEAIVDHCDGTNQILLGLVTSPKVQALVWLALASAVLPKADVERLAGDELKD